MKAAMFYGAGDIRIEEVEVPKPSDGHVLVKVAWSVTCDQPEKIELTGPFTGAASAVLVRP